MHTVASLAGDLAAVDVERMMAGVSHVGNMEGKGTPRETVSDNARRPIYMANREVDKQRSRGDVQIERAAEVAPISDVISKAQINNSSTISSRRSIARVVEPHSSGEILGGWDASRASPRH